jgi:beta-mannanase
MWEGRKSGLSILAAFVGAVMVVGPSSSQDNAHQDGRPIKPPNGLALGVYDPHGEFGDDKDVSIEHVFLPWEDVDLSMLAAASSYARDRGRSLLVTVEPRSWPESKRIQPHDLLRGILDGAYDANVAAICSEIGRLSTPTTIRWAHEMEDITGRFPWAGWAPEDYKAAYRKFVTGCKALAPNARFMWSPKGLKNLADYYPGDDVVDAIGLSIYGLQKYDWAKVGRDRTFAELLRPGYDRVMRYKKPIYVAEVGYAGKADYVRNWSNSLLRPDPMFAELKGVVYFNEKEVTPWPEGYGLPDWRVSANTLP